MGDEEIKILGRLGRMRGSRKKLSKNDQIEYNGSQPTCPDDHFGMCEQILDPF